MKLLSAKSQRQKYHQKDSATSRACHKSNGSIFRDTSNPVSMSAGFPQKWIMFTAEIHPIGATALSSRYSIPGLIGAMKILSTTMENPGFYSSGMSRMMGVRIQPDLIMAANIPRRKSMMRSMAVPPDWCGKRTSADMAPMWLESQPEMAQQPGMVIQQSNTSAWRPRRI